MTMTINIPPELEGRLQEEAERRGVAADELARIFLEERLLFSGERPLWEDADEWEREFDKWIASQDSGRTPLPDSAMSRESFYGNRG